MSFSDNSVFQGQTGSEKTNSMSKHSANKRYQSQHCVSLKDTKRRVSVMHSLQARKYPRRISGVPPHPKKLIKQINVSLMFQKTILCKYLSSPPSQSFDKSQLFKNVSSPVLSF